MEVLHSRIEGEGQPLLIVHGFLGMSDNWKSLASQYVANGFQVHAVDMRNHGKSFRSEEFTYSSMAADLLAYLDAHAIAKAAVIGHSMGGKAAMLFAAGAPERVDKLIVADIGPKYYAPHHQDILAGLNAVDFTLKPSRADVDAILTTYIDDFGTRQFLMKNLYWEEPGQLAFRFNLRVFNEKIENIGEALPAAAVYEGETLFLRGDRSIYIKDADLEGIKQHFPNARFATIANSGHWLHAENPADFLTETLRFLT